MALEFPYVIAEAGTGHQGNLNQAVDLVYKSFKAGADAVKFQMFVPDEPLFCPLPGDEDRIPRWNKSAMPYDSWKKVKGVCDEYGIDFLASVFQPTAVEWIKRLEPVAYKVASRAAREFPYDELPGPFIISLGFYDVSHLKEGYCLQCIPEYPCPLERARWRDADDGLSDHSGTPWPAIDALSQGAQIIEVHVGEPDGPDAAVALSFDQFKLITEFRDALARMQDSGA